MLNWFFCFHCQKFMTKFATPYCHWANTELLYLGGIEVVALCYEGEYAAICPKESA